MPNGLVNNTPSLVHIMAWHRTGDRPLYEPMMAKFIDACLYNSASMSYCKKLRCSICMWRQSDVMEAIPRKLFTLFPTTLVGIGLPIFIRIHDDVIKWKHFPRYWPFARGIHWSPVNSPHKGQWRGALVFSLICAWVNNREAGDLRHHRAHYDVTMLLDLHSGNCTTAMKPFM